MNRSEGEKVKVQVKLRGFGNAWTVSAIWWVIKQGPLEGQRLPHYPDMRHVNSVCSDAKAVVAV